MEWFLRVDSSPSICRHTMESDALTRETAKEFVREVAVVIVQLLKIGERPNGRWNGSRELIVRQEPAIKQSNR